MRARTKDPRGFSLVELLVSLVVSTVVIAGAVALMLASQRNFRSTASSRALQETARVALGHVANNLRTAGFAVDPMLTFDLGPMQNVRVDLAFGGAQFTSTSTPSTAGTCNGLCRDSTTGPDEIVFFSRDPAFGPHPLTAAASGTSTSLTVAGSANTAAALQRGQLLQVACYAGSMTWTYVQVSGAASYNGNGTVTIPIASTGTNFTTERGWLADTCFSTVATMVANAISQPSLSSAAEVFKLDRYRYYVQTFDSTGNAVAWGTVGARPYLMLDQGLLDGSGNAIVSPVAPDVEDLQFAYVYPYDAAVPVVGATPGTALANSDAGVNLAPANGGPAFSDDPLAPTRQNHHPGNIGAVRIWVVVRSSDADPSQPQLTAIPAAGNRAATTGPAGYVRLLVDTTVQLQNYGVTAAYNPSYGSFPAAPGNRNFNVGGG
jgi:prepilin-type N-terminal cleavage/methylation domain-containing protein